MTDTNLLPLLRSAREACECFATAATTVKEEAAGTAMADSVADELREWAVYLLNVADRTLSPLAR